MERQLRPLGLGAPLTTPKLAAEGFDGEVEWGAKLLQPTSPIVHGSAQPLVVEVEAPVVLERQPVEFLIGGAWRSGSWAGDPGRKRQAIIVLGEFVPRGRSRVLVRVRDGNQAPVLRAGSLRAR